MNGRSDTWSKSRFHWICHLLYYYNCLEYCVLSLEDCNSFFSHSPPKFASTSVVECLSCQTSRIMSLLRFIIRCPVVFVSIFLPLYCLFTWTYLFARYVCFSFSSLMSHPSCPCFLPFSLTIETVRWPRWHHLTFFELCYPETCIYYASSTLFL